MKTQHHASIFFAVMMAGQLHADDVATSNFTGMSGSEQTQVTPTPDANDFTWTLIGPAGDSLYEVSFNIGGAIRTATISNGWKSFESVFMRNGNIKGDFLVDSVSVSKTR